MMKSRLLLTLAALLALARFASADVVNGFDLSGSSIPDQEIYQGGPPKDGIPSIDRPKFLSAGDAALDAEDQVLGVFRNGVAKAYPVRILNWHEIVNDRFGNENVAVTYCPLCRSGIAFRATVKGKPATFGVSGLLYDNNVLLYDRETESLWSQMKHRAVTGPLKGEMLEPLPVSNTTWGWWRMKYPSTLVLSEDTGYQRDYRRDPYGDYATLPMLHFPISAVSQRYGLKEVVVGVEVAGRYKAYPLTELEKGVSRIRDTVAGQTVELRFDRKSRTAVVRAADGEEIPNLVAYWFAWYAFHPDTEVYEAKNKEQGKQAKQAEGR